MALEPVTHISDLVITNPTNTDPKSEGDDHIRNIKKALKADLPNITGPITANQTQINVLAGVSSNGLLVRTAAGSGTARTLTAGEGITITNGDGVSGNPTIAVNASDLPNSAFLVSYTPAGTGAVATTVQTKLREHVSVKDFGALGDGTTDDTAAIQSAITYVALLGAGKVYFPVGVYVHSGIDLPGGVSLVGAGWEPYTAYATTATFGAGSWLKMTATGRPAIHVKKRVSGRTSGSQIKNMAMKWDHATPGGGWTPTVYDWAIKVESSDDVLLENLLLANPYKGIQITGTTTDPAGRLTAKNIFGQPLLQGIEVDFSVDVSSFDRIHFWPYWSDNANVLSWMKTNSATAIKTLRSDNTEFSNIFGYGYRLGIHVSANAFGTTLRLRGQNIDFDDATRAFWVDSSAAGSSGSFTNFHATANPANTLADMYVQEANTSDWQFSNLRLSNSQQHALLVSGTNANLRVSNFWADQWNIALGGDAAVSVGTDAKASISNQKLTQGNGAVAAAGLGVVVLDEWIAYTPVLTAGTGTITTATVTGEYMRGENSIEMRIEIDLVTNGTAATSLIVTLPFTASGNSVLHGREYNATGKGVTGQILNGQSTCVIRLSADNGYPGGNSTKFSIVGSYRAA